MKHRISTIEMDKLVLSPYDDKRNINYFTNETVPWGYYKNKNPHHNNPTNENDNDDDDDDDNY